MAEEAHPEEEEAVATAVVDHPWAEEVHRGAMAVEEALPAAMAAEAIHLVVAEVANHPEAVVAVADFPMAVAAEVNCQEVVAVASVLPPFAVPFLVLPAVKYGQGWLGLIPCAEQPWTLVAFRVKREIVVPLPRRQGT